MFTPTKIKEAENHRTMAAYFAGKGMEERAVAHRIAADKLAPLKRVKSMHKELCATQGPECGEQDCDHVL